MTNVQALVLVQAIEALQEIAKAATSAASSAPSASSAFELQRVVRAQDYGRLAGTASLAADAVFSVLNVGNAYCGLPAAAYGLSARYNRVEQEIDGA